MTGISTKLQRLFLTFFVLSLPVSISGAELSIVLSAILLFILSLPSFTKSPLFPMPLFIPLLVFFLGHVISAFTGPEASESLRSIDWVFITMPVTVGAMRVVGADRRPILIFLTVGVIVSMYALAQAFYGIDLVRPEGEKAIVPFYGAEGRYLPIGTFRHHLTYAHQYQFVFLFLLTMAVHHIRDRKHLALTVPATLIVGLSLLFTYSRGVWVSIAIGSILVVVLLWGKRGALLSIAAVVLSVLIMSSSGSFGERVASITSKESNVERLTIYQIHWDAVKDYPVFGHGPGRYREAMAPYYDRYPQKDDMPMVHAHNNFLQVWLNAGLIGLFGFIWLNVAFLRRAWNHVRRRSFRTPLGGSVLVSAIASVMAFLISGLSQYNLGDSEVALAYWFVMGLALWEMDDWNRRWESTG